MLLSPCSRFRFLWDALMLVLLAYCCVVVPYRIPLTYGQTSLDALTIVDLVLSAVFTFDIWLNLNTGV